MTAILSSDGKYRYFLDRSIIPAGDRVLTFIMLNPSTADAERDDPTIRKCKGFALRNDFHILNVVNLFGYRSPYPAELKKADNPVGAANADNVLKSCEQSDMIICAWGNHGSLFGQDRKTIDLLRGFDLYALGLTNSGQPKHPLYVPYDKKPFKWRTKRG